MNESPRLVWLLSTPAVGETQADLDIASFFFFLILCSCDKARALPKERDSLCLWIAICVFKYFMQKNMARDRKKVKFVQILPHVWVNLDMSGGGIWT